MSKDTVDAFLTLLGSFRPAWVLAILVSVTVAYRLPAILKEVFTGLREHAKIRAEIDLKQRKAEQEIAEKRAKIKGGEKGHTR